MPDAVPVSACDVHDIFRLFTLPQADFHKYKLILDVRDYKQFSKRHVYQAFAVRLTADGGTLLDYSKSEYKTRWSSGVWVGREVYVYGGDGLKKDHPVIGYLASHGAGSVRYLREGGLPAVEAAYPYLITASVKVNAIKYFPSQVEPGVLYLGEWSHASAADRLAELNVRGIVTIHDNPDTLKPQLPRGVRWLKFEIPDVETADISITFKDTYDFIEVARSRKEAVLVHCGAGMSRSATLCAMYLMRRHGWSAQKAKDFLVSRRSVVNPNDGFWRTLCALEGELGIADRSDPNATSGFRGADADDDGPPLLSGDAAGGKVPVVTLSQEEVASRKRERDSARPAEEPAAKRPSGSLARPLTVTLEIRKPEGAVGELVIGPMAPNQRVVFGRLPSTDVVLEHASISRMHAALSADVAGTVLLTDLQSAHGTKLDDVWIKPNAARALRVGSRFQLGASTRTYVVIAIAKH